MHLTNDEDKEKAHTFVSSLYYSLIIRQMTNSIINYNVTSDNMLSRFHLIPDGRRDGQNCYITR